MKAFKPLFNIKEIMLCVSFLHISLGMKGKDLVHHKPLLISNVKG
jgi:hypothetical protein